MQQSLDEAADRGHLPGINAKGWLNAYWDPREDYDPTTSEPETDETWARETPAGVELRRHPEVELGARPWLWPAVRRFRAGLRRELTSHEIETWSAIDVECWHVLVAAEARERARRLRRKVDGGGDAP